VAKETVQIIGNNWNVLQAILYGFLTYLLIVIPFSLLGIYLAWKDRETKNDTGTNLTA